MIDASSHISGAFRNTSVLQLFQSASIDKVDQNGAFHAAAEVEGTFGNAASKAIDSIIQIVMAANGDTSTSIDTQGQVSNASTGDGNDTININAARAYAVTSGAGNDVVNITVGGGSDRQHGTDGDHGHHGDHGHGNAMLPTVMGVGTGDGNDTLNIDAHGVVMAVSGEAGNDTVNVKTNSLAFGVYGGEGNDTVNVDAKFATLVDGGDGNDVVNVKASSMFGISGGKGDDVINLDNTGSEAAQYFYSQGDGKDIINSNGAVSINLFSADGTAKLDMSAATWSQSGNTVTIAFGNTGDAITVNLTGDAATGKASVSYDDKTGNLVIGPGTPDDVASQTSVSVSASASISVSG